MTDYQIFHHIIFNIFLSLELHGIPKCTQFNKLKNSKNIHFTTTLIDKHFQWPAKLVV